MLGTWASCNEFCQGPVYQPIRRLRCVRDFGPIAHSLGGGTLVFHLMKLALARSGFIKAGRQHKQGN